MDITEYRNHLANEYRRRDVTAIIRLVRDLMKESFFPQLVREWEKAGKLDYRNLHLDQIAGVLLRETAAAIEANGELTSDDTYFMIEDSLKQQFNENISDIYLSTVMPEEFLCQIRENFEQGDSSRLSDSLVNLYKEELIRIEAGRRAVVEVLQQYSNFPIQNVTALSQHLNQMHQRLKSSYKYITIKPYLLLIFRLQKEADPETTLKHGTISLFRDYINRGEEPSLIEQLRLQIVVNTLLLQIKKQEVLGSEEFIKYWDAISKIWGYRCAKQLDLKVRDILEQLLSRINADQDAILKRLARTFVAEYRAAEEQMKIRRRLIQNELACTWEYLKRAADSDSSNSETEERVKIAQEKLIGLDGVFHIPSALKKATAEKTLLELERNALAISTSISADQITDWIRIYSILFSNSEFLTYTEESIDFSTMRELISNLSTYHLILNIAELKEIIDRSLRAAGEDRSNQFKRFQEALKRKLRGLIGKSSEKKSLVEIIRDLEFLDSPSIQFVIADTFRGFQAIADAFTATANDFFVKDREALLKESQELYYEICDQCLKNFVLLPNRQSRRPEPPPGSTKSKKPSSGRRPQG